MLFFFPYTHMLCTMLILILLLLLLLLCALLFKPAQLCAAIFKFKFCGYKLHIYKMNILCVCGRQFCATVQQQQQQKIPKLQLDWLCNFDDRTRLFTKTYSHTVCKYRCVQLKFHFMEVIKKNIKCFVCVCVCAFVIHFMKFPCKKKRKHKHTHTLLLHVSHAFSFYVYIELLIFYKIFLFSLSIATAMCARERAHTHVYFCNLYLQYFTRCAHALKSNVVQLLLIFFVVDFEYRCTLHFRKWNGNECTVCTAQ